MSPRTVPDRVIDGDGFTLRALGRADVADVALACADPLTQRWLPLPDPYTTDTAPVFVGEMAVAQRETGAGAVFGVDVSGHCTAAST